MGYGANKGEVANLLKKTCVGAKLALAHRSPGTHASAPAVSAVVVPGSEVCVLAATVYARVLAPIALVLALFSLSCGQELERTQVMVVFDADAGVRARAEALSIRVWSGARGKERNEVYSFTQPKGKLALGSLPSRARGYGDASARDAHVVSAVSAQRSRIASASADADIARALEAAEVLPDLEIVSTDCSTVSLAERVVANGHVFLLFNEHSKACRATLRVRVPSTRASLLDSRNGAQKMLARADEVTVTLEARRPLVLFVEP